MIDIRPADASDLGPIAALHAYAFAASDHGHHGEGDLVRMLHAEGDVLASLCAWADGAIVGHVLFSRMAVEADGAPIAAAALGPVGVLPSYRRRGMAAALIEGGHDQLRAQGVRLAFVLGDPAYYGRFGYTATRAAPFESPYAGPYLMACALDSAPPRPQRGRALHAPAFSRLA